MWQCPKCKEKLEDSFDVCWNCGTSRDGTEDPAFHKEEEVVPASQAPEANDDTPSRPAVLPAACPACGGAITRGKVSLQLSGWGEVERWLDVVTAGAQEHCVHHGYFDPDDGGAALQVIPAGESRDALHCKQCGTVVVLATPARK